MPTIHIVLSEKVENLSDDQIRMMREVVAEGLDSASRRLDGSHISVRLHRSKRKFMLGDIEIEVFAQFYLRRFISRDKRCNWISSQIQSHLGIGCATWINLAFVGYCRVDQQGGVFFSD